MSRKALFPILVVSLIIVTTGLFLGNKASLESGSTAFLIAGYCLSLAAVIVGLRRGTLYGYAFWFPLVSAYPLLSPFLIQYLLGFPYFSFFARDLQTPSALAAPVFLGGLATLLLSLAIPSVSRDYVKAIHGARSTAAPRLGARTAKIVLFGTLAPICLFAWLAEPGQIVGVVDYGTLREQRISGANFAGGAWVLFEVVGLAAYLRVRRARSNTLAVVLFWGATAVSFVWLFLHARRSETLGLAILLFCVLRPRRPEGRITNWINLRVLLLTGVAVIFAAIGYFRTTLDWSSLGQGDYLQSPGGGGNNLLTYIAGYWLHKERAVDLTPGETYWWHVLDLPPKIITEAMKIGVDTNAYDVVEAKVDLMGGQYWLMEPVLNFGAVGIAGYALLVSAIVAWAHRRILLYEAGKVGIHSFVQAGVFLALMFRTIWYGPAAAINGCIMAVFVAGFLGLMMFISKARYRVTPIDGGTSSDNQGWARTW